jgi:integrase
MASIEKQQVKRGHNAGRVCWRAQVYVKGVREQLSFDTKAAAQAWASEREHQLRTQALSGVDLSKTVGDALRRYSAEWSPKKASGGWEQRRLAAFERVEIIQGKCLGEFKLAEFTTAHYAAFRDARLAEVSGETVNREMNLLGHVFSIARKEWKWIVESPTKEVSRPKPGLARTRRINDDEIERTCHALGFVEGEIARTKSQRVAIAFLFAIETAMRAGEIRNLQRGRPKEPGACYLKSPNVAHLGITKNGHPRDVPLSSRAKELIALLPLTGPDLFGLGTREQLDAVFRKALKRTMIEDLHFHDTRHEAISRLAKRYQVLDLARITGHRDLNELMTYYHSDAEELAQAMRADAHK